MRNNPDRLLTCVIRILLLISMARFARAQQTSEQARCNLSTVNSVPSRPSVSNSTDTTECGVVEVEYGFERFWVADGSHRQDVSGGLRVGITPNLDFHWASADYLSLSANGVAVEGFGDTWLGLKYRFFGQGAHWPGLGFFYQVKIPTSRSAGLGSGKVDHSLAILFSKDVHPLHFDFNVIPTLIGSERGAGFDHSTGLALATWVPVRSKLGLVLEPYGYTAANSSTPGFASLTGALSYQVRPRFFLDAGADAGITEAAPHKRFFGGFTYALGNAFSFFRPRSSPLSADTPVRK